MTDHADTIRRWVTSSSFDWFMLGVVVGGAWFSLLWWVFG